VNRAAASAAVALLLYGCAAVGPEYHRPALASPEQWHNTDDSRTSAPTLAQAAWWRAFNDPALNRLIEKALAANLELEQARARIVQARANVDLAAAPSQPHINAAGSVNRSRTSEHLSSAAGGKTSTLYQAGFDAGWELDVFGGTRRSVEAAQARLDARVEDLHAAVLTLLGDVSKNYIDLRANQTQLQITHDTLKAMEDNAALTRERFRLGLTSYLDVTQAESQQAAVEANIPSLDAAAKAAMHRLAILLGQPPAALVAELSAARPLPKADILLAPGLPAELLARRPDLRAAERQLAAASADIGVAVSGLYPTFDLTLGLGLQANSASAFAQRASRYWSFVPGVAVPLLDGGKARADIRAKQAVYDELLAQYRAAFHTSLEDVENGLTVYYAEREKNKALANSVRITGESLTLAFDRYRRGLTTYIDVLTAQRSLYIAQSSLVQSDAQQLTNIVALYKALGGGWENHI